MAKWEEKWAQKKQLNKDWFGSLMRIEEQGRHIYITEPRHKIGVYDKENSGKKILYKPRKIEGCN
jgi:hypothetical protein